MVHYFRRETVLQNLEDVRRLVRTEFRYPATKDPLGPWWLAYKAEARAFVTGAPQPNNTVFLPDTVAILDSIGPHWRQTYDQFLDDEWEEMLQLVVQYRKLYPGKWPSPTRSMTGRSRKLEWARAGAWLHRTREAANLFDRGIPIPTGYPRIDNLRLRRLRKELGDDWNQ